MIPGNTPSNLAVYRQLVTLVTAGRTTPESESIVNSFFATQSLPRLSVARSVAAFGSLIDEGRTADRETLVPAIVVADSVAITDRWAEFFAVHLINRSNRLPAADIAELLEAVDEVDRIGALLEIDGWNMNRTEDALSLAGMRTAFSGQLCRGILRVNTYDGVEWFDRAGYSEIVSWLILLGAFALLEADRFVQDAASLMVCLRAWLEARNNSAYEVTRLFAYLEDRYR